MFSRLYAGSQHSTPAYIPILQDLNRFLPWSSVQKKRCILRTDAGFGSDANVDFALDDDWQVLTKGSGGRRPGAFARLIAAEDWREVGVGRWIAPSVKPPSYVQPIRHWVSRWLTPQKRMKHATLLCSILDWDERQAMAFYDDRGTCEVEIRADKSGLKLCKRRKHHLAAQEALILLTDLAHNLLAWNAQRMFPEGPLAAFGTTRLVEDVLAIPGHLVFSGSQLVEVQLNCRHPYAALTAPGLERLFAYYGNP